MTYFNKNMPSGVFNWRGANKWLLMVLLISSNQLTAKDINLATAINLMLEENPSLKIFELRKRSLEGAQYTAGLNPEIEMGLEAENFLGSKPYTAFDQSELTVSVSSVIELGGKKDARKNYVSTKYGLLDAQRKIKSLDLISELTDAFIDALATQARIKLAEESVRLSEDIYESVKRKAKAGAISDVEVKRSYASLKQAQLTLQGEQSKLERQSVNLSLYWSEKQPQFSHLSGELFDFGVVKEIGELHQNLEKSNLIQVLTMKQRLAESRLVVVQAESAAEVNWSLGVRRFDESNDAALTAGISVPLFKRKRNKGTLMEVEAEIDSSHAEQRIALLKLYGQINEFYSLRQAAIEKFNTLENEIIPALAHALELTKEAYLDGRYGYLEYSAARADLIQSKKSLIDTAQSILNYGVQLERITAEPIYNETQQIQGGDS
jgi:cobalt-zinc-cadmium efflux system outer membrane protein